MVGGQRIQVGLAHARKTVAATVGPDTIQVAVETGITVTAARTTSRDSQTAQGIELRLRIPVQQGQASGDELRCRTLPLNSLIARVDGVTLIAQGIKEA